MPIERLQIEANQITFSHEFRTRTQVVKPESGVDDWMERSFAVTHETIEVVLKDAKLSDYFGVDEQTLELDVKVAVSGYSGDAIRTERVIGPITWQQSSCGAWLDSWPINDDALLYRVNIASTLPESMFNSFKMAMYGGKIVGCRIDLKFEPVGWFDEIGEETDISVEQLLFY